MATLSSVFPASATPAVREAALSGKGKGEAAVAAAPSAHAEERTEAVLVAFDLDSRFGPCTGITRLQRYERACSNAELHGAPPPPPQLKELLKDERFTNNVWQGRI